MNHLRIFLEAIIMALGLALVIITLSGTTRTLALWISAASVVFYIASQYTGDNDNDSKNS